MSDDIIKLARDAREQGWDVSRTNKGHWRFIPHDSSKPIVVASGTPSDWRSYANLMAQLKRSGFLTEEERKTVEGEKKVEIQATAPKEPVAVPEPPSVTKAPMGSLKKLILEAFKVHPNHQMSFEDLKLVLKSKHPKLTTSSIYGSATNMVNTGLLTRPERGFLRLVGQKLPGPSAETHQRAVKQATPESTDFTDKLARLDAALASLADVEKLIRETQQEIRELAEFRRKLKDIL